MAEPILLTVAQAAEVLSIGQTTLRNEVAAGRLPVVHIGRAVRIHYSDLLDYAERLRAAREPTYTTVLMDAAKERRRELGLDRLEGSHAR
jgi:excisionase family DNA binding protein